MNLLNLYLTHEKKINIAKTMWNSSKALINSISRNIQVFENQIEPHIETEVQC